MLFLMLLPLLLITYCWKYMQGKNVKSLANKHVCIVGGSSGIGKSVAIEASRMGAHVTIIARDRHKLDAALDEIQAAKQNDGQQFVAVSLDCSEAFKAIEEVKRIDRAHPIFMFVCCAGYASCGRFEDFALTEIKKQFDVNYFATVYPLTAILPRMKQRNEGIAIITGSQGGLFGIYGYSLYASTKFALRGLAEVLRMEYKDYGVSITLCLPPDTDTPGFETENRTKPQETKLISESAALVQPEVVAKQMLKDALNGDFLSYTGVESWMITTLCVGMSPFMSLFEIVYQAIVMGPLRLVSAYYIASFQKIVTKCKVEREVAEKES